ncbi:TPA: hypothetical protein ACGO4K_000307 [Streptococcus suis]
MDDIKVIEWLNYCDENNMKPWLWDFKNCYSTELTSDSITNFLKYKNGELVNPTTFCITKKVGSNADCDKEALPLYNVLGWQHSESDIIRGETINSYITTFTQAITKDPNYKEICEKIGVNLNEYLNKQYPILYHNKSYQKFETIQRNIKEFELFAILTHSIGNFTVLPHWMNTGRYNFSKDYWDITMLSLQEWFAILPNGTWNSFVNTFYLQPYVNDKYEVELFWDNHTDSKPFPELQHYSIFLKKVNERIEERGKFIIKQVCDKLNKKDYHFYKEIENMDKIKFSNEF